MDTNGEVAPVAQEKINTNIVTLTRFLTEEQTKHKEATGDFTYIFALCLSYAMLILCLVFYATLCSFHSSPLLTTSGGLR